MFLQKEEHERGFAHLVEHMAFSGTEHFPGTGMMNYLAAAEHFSRGGFWGNTDVRYRNNVY